MQPPPAVTLDRPRLSLTKEGEQALERRNDRETVRLLRMQLQREKERREQRLHEGLDQHTAGTGCGIRGDSPAG